MSEFLFANEFVQVKRHIHTPSSWARSNLLVLQETGSLQAVKAHTSRREGLSSYLFFVVTGGSGTVSSQGREKSVKAGDCVFIDCSKPYTQCSSPEDLWSLSWVHFTGPFMDAVYEKYVARGGDFVFTPEDVTVYRNLLPEIYEVAENNSYVCDMELNSRLSYLIEHLMQETVVQGQLQVSEVPTKRKDLQLAKEFIDSHYAETVSLETVAEKLYINKSYLAKIFKDKYGTTVNHYIQQVRINKAKEYLRFSDKTMEEIGIVCGMPDSNYFSRVFKKVEGCTPSEYRKQW
ncbi:MAG: AraC family transcriptional regulator [Acetatifactor sp.]|nr:AraC family transcriptional regulator [Acetatifactor sp.]